MILNNLYLIVAITEKSYSIGKDNELIHFTKEDMNFFKEKTMGNNIICGRKTFESFTIKPLPKRTNIVLTRSNFNHENTIVFNSIDILIDYIQKHPEEKFFLCGGESIYRQLIDNCSKLYVTMYEEKEKVDADSFFPEIEESKWKLIDTKIGESTNPKLRFCTYERKDVNGK